MAFFRSACLLLLGWQRVSAASIAHRAPAAVTDCKLASVPGINLSEGFGRPAGCAPSTGSLNAFMFFVDFPDAVATETPESLHRVFLPEATQWYANSSYGRLALNVTADMGRFYRMPARADSYNWTRGLTNAIYQRYLQDAVEAYSKVKAPLVSDVLYVVATTKATAISFSPTYMSDVRARGGGPVLARKAVAFGADAYASWRFKVLNHETGHAMCLPDLYAQTGSQHRYVGGWDMMGYINGASPDYLAWHKWKLGWLDDAQIACVSSAGAGTYTIGPVEAAGGGTKAVVVRRNATSVIVAEVRSNLAGNPCRTGVLLYTVSTSVHSGDGPVRVLDTVPGAGCQGDVLNDAPLAVGGSYVHDGVKFSVTGRNGTAYVVDVQY